MRFSQWQLWGCSLLLATSAATYSAAQNTSGQNNDQGGGQGAATQSSDESKNGNSNPQQGQQGQQGQSSANKDRDQQNSQSKSDQKDQNQKDQKDETQSNSNSNTSNSQNNSAESRDDDKSASERSVLSDQNKDQDQRSSRDSDNRDRDGARDRDRSDDSTRDRTDREPRDQDRSARDRSDRDGSRNRDTRRDLRGPDIGVWFNRGSRDGLVIADITTRGAFARFGFREGDRIVSINGQRVTTEADFVRLVTYGDSDRVKVIVIRDGSEEIVYVEPQVITREYEAVDSHVDPLERFGIIVDDRYDDKIVVWRVIPRSPAYYAGFRPGDVVLNFGGRPYNTRSEFERSAVDWKDGDVDVQVRRGEKTRDLSVTIPKYDRATARSADRRAERVERRADNNNQQQPNYNQQQQSGRRINILNRGR